MDDQVRKKRWSSVAGMLGALALALAGCRASDDRALVIFDVSVSSDVPAFSALTLTSSDPTIPPRSLDGPSHRQPFQLGYYVPHPSGMLTVVGQAVQGDGCIVGEGSATTSGLGPRMEVKGGPLVIAKLAPPRCPVADGGPDAAIDGAREAGAGAGDGGVDAPREAPREVGDAGSMAD